MKLHGNAKTTPKTRQLLARRVLEEGWTIARAAKAVGLSRTSARRWIERYRREGERGLEDRSSRPRRLRKTPARLESAVLALRRKQLVSWAIARELGLARSTVGAILRRHGLERLKNLQPQPPVVRYERARPGELVHLDTKKLARFEKPGHRIHGDRSRTTRGVGWDFVHLAIDDHSRLSYVEVLADETGPTTAAFWKRALSFYARRGIQVERVLTDNGPGYLSRAFRDLCRTNNTRHLRTRPYTPRTNGKAERFVKTLLHEWAYRRSYRSSRERNRALPAFAWHYNHRRPHGSLGYLPPVSRLRGWKQPA